MFVLSTLFQIIFRNASKNGWTNRKTVSKDLTSVLTEDAHAYISDTDFNKYFSGKNKGRTLSDIVQEDIEVKGFHRYLFQVEIRLAKINYKENKFNLTATLDDVAKELKEANNLPVSVQIGLEQSYRLNYDVRPYLFLAECLYYALVCYHQTNITYQLPDTSQETNLTSKPLEDLVAKATGYPRRIIQALNQFSEEELELFKRIAPLTFFDESYEHFSGKSVFDHYLISHADFEQLFFKYGVRGNDISRLIEYGLISGGGRHEIVVTKGELSGFQNNNLILTFTANSDDTITFEYSAFHLSDTAKALIEILQINTNDEFFRELGECFVNKTKKLDIEIKLIEVSEFNGLL